MRTPLVSILIPTYNRQELIGETLASVLTQTCTNWECIIVDDGSSDDTEGIVTEFIKNDSRFQLYKRPAQRPKGANACRNVGMEKANGEYIQWFDSDDLMHPQLLEMQLKKLLDSEKNISLCNFCFFRDKAKISTTDSLNLPQYFKEDKLLHNFVSGDIIINTQMAFMHKKIAQSIRFDEQLSRAQDLDFMFRLLFKNRDQVILNAHKLAYVRRHKNSITDTFKNRNSTLIDSEIKVRKLIWNRLQQSAYPKQTIQGAFSMYLKSLKYLLYVRHFSKFRKCIIELFAYDKLAINLLLIKLIAISYLFKFTGRGMALYQRTINTIKS